MRHLLVTFAIAAMVLGLTPRTVLAQAAQTTPALDSMTVAQLVAAGDTARAQKDFDQSIKYFEAALRKDRNNAVLYNKLGLTTLKQGDLARARVNFQKAAKYDPKLADALNNVGAVDYMQKNYNSAAKQFKKAIALEETRATFHVNLGAAWFGQKKLERAITEYARALELDPQVLATNSKTGVAAQIASPEERANYSYMLAKIYAKRGNTEECLRCLKMAKEEGYRNMKDVYRDEEFAGLRRDTRLAEIVPAPDAK